VSNENVQPRSSYPTSVTSPWSLLDSVNVGLVQVWLKWSSSVKIFFLSLWHKMSGTQALDTLSLQCMLPPAPPSPTPLSSCVGLVVAYPLPPPPRSPLPFKPLWLQWNLRIAHSFETEEQANVACSALCRDWIRCG
jgi:hypothetical protein